MGIGVSLILIAVGAILTWAVSAEVSGVDIQTVGVILLVVGAIGAIMSLIFWSSWGGFGGRPTADDGGRPSSTTATNGIARATLRAALWRPSSFPGRPRTDAVTARTARSRGRGPTAARSRSALRLGAALPAAERGRSGSAPYRADERSHHVPQEAVGRDRERELVAASLTAAAETWRTKTSCCVSVGVKARKSCSPGRSAAAAASRSSSSRRGHQSTRRRSSGEGTRRARTR